MPLSLRVRKSNHVAIVDCTGRIVAGEEAASLEAEVRKWIANHCNVVLNLSGVEFIDSSGLGLLVRLATSTRDDRVGIRFCSPVTAVKRVIALTMLDHVLQPYDTEEQAISSFLNRKPSSSSPISSPGNILCADDSPNLLAYLREGLGLAGYRVHSASIVPDALMLLKAMRPRLVIAGPRFAEKLSPRAAEMNIAMIKLPTDFCTTDAGQALGVLVSQLRTILQ